MRTTPKIETTNDSSGSTGRRGYWEIRREEGKPTARGMIHGVAAPLALINTIALIVVAESTAEVVAAVVFLFASITLFGHSAIYHLGNWTPRVREILRKIDHANIFVLIAGTYTPITVHLLEGSDRVICLSIVWGGAVVGSIMHVSWVHFPRWLYVALYIAVGWVAVWYLPTIWRSGSPLVVWLVIIGGIIYTIGAMFYAFKWPNPWPEHFGFHEFFHLCTVLAYACHCVAIWLAYFTN